jgi:hypothetical protein
MQAQAVLTLRIYHSVSLYNDSSLTPLQIPMYVSNSWASRTPTIRNLRSKNHLEQNSRSP